MAFLLREEDREVKSCSQSERDLLGALGFIGDPSINHSQKIETSHQSHVSHVWAHGIETRQGTPSVYKSTGGSSCGGPEPAANPPQQVTMAERKLPCCCGSSISQCQSTMGPNLPSSLGSNLASFPPSPSLCPSFTAPVRANDSPPCGTLAQWC